MRRTSLFSTGLLMLGLLLAACGDVGDAPQAQTGEAVTLGEAEGMQLAIDTSQSSVSWRGAKVTGAHDGGFNTFDGTVMVDGDQVTGVDLVIDMTSIWSDTPKLTRHLRSEDFFTVETYPEATFEATQFEVVDSTGATHLITGNLTMVGQTNGVTFPATIEVGDGMASAEADFIIDRQRWGISYPGQPDDLISDEVRITFDVTATGAAMEAEEPTAEAMPSE